MMINAWWLLPAVMAGAVFGYIIGALMAAGRDEGAGHP